MDPDLILSRIQQQQQSKTTDDVSPNNAFLSALNIRAFKNNNATPRIERPLSSRSHALVKPQHLLNNGVKLPIEVPQFIRPEKPKPVQVTPLPLLADIKVLPSKAGTKKN